MKKIYRIQFPSSLLIFVGWHTWHIFLKFLLIFTLNLFLRCLFVCCLRHLSSPHPLILFQSFTSLPDLQVPFFPFPTNTNWSLLLCERFHFFLKSTPKISPLWNLDCVLFLLLRKFIIYIYLQSGYINLHLITPTPLTPPPPLINFSHSKNSSALCSWQTSLTLFCVADTRLEMVVSLYRCGNVSVGAAALLYGSYCFIFF